ncbi:MAG: hypothetical protein ACRD5K_13375 [Candidatus Acidiferrales bacterium]
MGLFGRKSKDVVVRWSPESDTTWEKQKGDSLFKPMKHIRCGGVSLMIASLDKTDDGKFVMKVSVSNYEQKVVGFNRGGFGLTWGGGRYPCARLKVRYGKVDHFGTGDREGEEVGFRDAVVSEFKDATFTAYFDSTVPEEAFVVVVEAKRIFGPHIIFATPYEKIELAVWGLGQ